MELSNRAKDSEISIVRAPILNLNGDIAAQNRKNNLTKYRAYAPTQQKMKVWITNLPRDHELTLFKTDRLNEQNVSEHNFTIYLPATR